MKQARNASRALSPVTVSARTHLRSGDHLDVGLVGDVLVSDGLFDQVDNGGRDLRDSLWRPLSDCPLIVANLEAPITSRSLQAENKAYNLKTSRRILGVFDSRFVLSLANNHVMDFGPQGLVDTLEALDAAGLAYVGAGRDLERARAPCYKSVDGVRVAVIGAADPRFQAAARNTPGTNPAILESLVDSVSAARDHAQVVVVTLHMGLEYADIPSGNQVLLGEACLDAGAHIVQFHHSHCLSGCAGNGRGVVLFGTGNYVFPQVTAFDSPKTRRAAVWVARYRRYDDVVAGLDMMPAAIDLLGLPLTLGDSAADLERRRLNRLSHRMLAPYWRTFWRVCDLLHPGFLVPTLRNYQAMARHQGLWCVVRSLLAGAKAQILK